MSSVDKNEYSEFQVQLPPPSVMRKGPDISPFARYAQQTASAKIVPYRTNSVLYFVLLEKVYKIDEPKTQKLLCRIFVKIVAFEKEPQIYGVL